MATLAQDQEPDDLCKPEGFVISLIKAGTFRRLHFVPSCKLVPRKHYKIFTDHGMLVLEDFKADAICRSYYLAASISWAGGSDIGHV